MPLVSYRDEGGPSWLWTALKKDKDFREQHKFRYPGSEKDEFLIEQFKPFFRSWVSGTDREDMKYAYPILTGAVDIWENTNRSSPRWILEAYLLTDMPAYEIAKAMCLPEGLALILAYSRLFFDVAERKKSPAWLNEKVLTPAAMSSPKFKFYKYVYKLVSLMGGRESFDLLMAHDIGNIEDQTLFCRLMLNNLVMKSLKNEDNNANLELGGLNIERAYRLLKEDSRKAAGDRGPEGPMNELATVMTDQFKLMGLDQILDSKEYVKTLMYTEEDIKDG